MALKSFVLNRIWMNDVDWYIIEFFFHSQFDQRVHKAFMKRTRLPNVNEANFYPGAKVSVFGRQIRLIDYADDATRKMLANRREKYMNSKWKWTYDWRCAHHFRTFCIIKSHAVRQLAEILKIMKEHEFIISNCAMVEIDSDICEELMVNGNSDEPILPGVVVALELVACDAVRRMQKLLGNIFKCIFLVGNGFWESRQFSFAWLHRKPRRRRQSWNRFIS